MAYWSVAVAAPENSSCRGTTISNGAHLMICTETAIGHANPGLFQTHASGFRVCHQFNMPSLWDALTAWHCGFFPVTYISLYNIYKAYN